MRRTPTRQRIPWRDDIIAMAGYWEPVAHLVRHGSAARNAWTDPYPLSAAMARTLAELGVNLVIAPYYKGFGMRLEAPQMAKTARFFRILEKHGIGKGVYINVGSVYADAFLPEHPEAEGWLTRDAFGRPHVYSEFYRRYFRFRPCHSHPEYADYVARAAAQAIREAGADFLSLDNCAQMPCYCETCVKAFPLHAHAAYPDRPAPGRASFLERFGHPFAGRLELPRGSARWPIDNMPAALDPGLFEWIRFRQGQYENSHARVTAAVRKASPKAALCWNMALDHGQFNALVWGLDPEIAHRQRSDFFYSEDSNAAGLEDGRLITHIRTFKYARALGNRAMFHNVGPGDDTRCLLNYAQAAAFNGGCLGKVLWATDDPRPYSLLKRALPFFRANRPSYLRTRPLSQAALLRCRDSETATWAEAQVIRLGVEQTLLKRSIQYDHLILDRLDELDRYPLLICAGTLCASDKTLAALARYVRQGGRLLCVGPVFQRDELGRLRGRDLHAEGTPSVGEWDARFAETNGRADPAETRALLRLPARTNSRLFCLPQPRPARPFQWDPNSNALPEVGKAHFAELQNVDELVGLLRLALPDRNLELAAPDNVLAGFFEEQDGARVIHLFDHESNRTVTGAEVRFEPPKGGPDTAVFKTLEGETPVSLARKDGRCVCVLPPFRTYGFLRIPGKARHGRRA